MIGVRVEHHTGGPDVFGFDLVGAVDWACEARIDEKGRGVLESGPLRAVIDPGAPFSLRFEADGRVLTSAGAKSTAHLLVADDAQVDGAPVGSARDGSGRALAPSYMLQQLSLGVGELVYGLGERFGPLVKNG